MADGNKPERFPNAGQDSPRAREAGGNGEAPVRRGQNVNDDNMDDAASEFGAGYGTGLGGKEGKRFGGGRKADAGYGGDQYLGGDNDADAGDPYGKPQRTRYNASTGSGSQYSAAKGHTPSPDENEKPRGKSQD
jgi:hypothetical protein